MDFENRAVHVIGAGAGIGWAYHHCFCKSGCMCNGVRYRQGKCRGNGRSSETSHSGSYCHYVADVRVKSEIEAMVEETTRRFDPVDILVNNAEICPSSLVS